SDVGIRIPTLDLRAASPRIDLSGEPLGRAMFDVIDREGALLVRTAMSQASDLAAFLSAIGHQPFASYVGGTSIRSEPVAPNVFKSTEMPPDVTIPLHQEMAYVAAIPDYITLFCSAAATDQQKTNLTGDMVEFTRTLADWVFQKYRGRKARLRRFLPPRGTSTGLNRMRRCWNDVIGTSDRDEARVIAAQRNWDLRWTDDDFVELLQEPFPFFREHPIHGEVWCTQAFAYLPVVQAYLAQIDGRVDDLDRMRAALKEAPEMLDTAVFEDGTPLDDEDALFIHKRLEGQTHRLALEQGELLILDNILRAHGRSPFNGTRKIFVALGVRR
ncbi:MAG: hypothetical protein JWN59_809, partial [Sphingomonas bacterium]|nr:hypothetical protein [Sphingomonas bacterium]